MTLVRPSFFLLSILVLYLFSPVHVEGTEMKQEISCTCPDKDGNPKSLRDGNKCKSEADKPCTGCDFGVTITKSADNKTFTFNLIGHKPKAGITEPYIALALSKDAEMGGVVKDPTLICSKSFDNLPKTFIIEGKSTPIAMEFTKGGPTNDSSSGKTVDGVASCTFTLGSNIEVDNEKIDLNKNVHYILLARGDIQGTDIQEHNWNNMCVAKFNLGSPAAGGAVSVAVSKFGLFFAFLPSLLALSGATF